jgi:hypothetical protein
MSRKNSPTTASRGGSAVGRPLAGGAILGTLAVAILFYPLPAHAYLDPASGSLFLQMLLGGIAGAALLIRMYWRKLLDVLGIGRGENDGEA